MGIQKARGQRSPDNEIAGLLAALRGDTDGALDCMNRAETADPDSLLVKYYTAEFLGLRLGDKAAAVKKCDLIISSAQSHPFVETEEDFGSEAYRKRAEQLKEKLG
jgi:hypothetical protein